VMHITQTGSTEDCQKQSVGRMRAFSQSGRFILKRLFNVTIGSFPALAGLSIILLGAVVLVGWHTRSPILIQISATLVPMQYNTALGFLLGGIGLLAAALGRERVAVPTGFFISSIGGITLAEYIFGMDLGVDQLFMEHYITVATSNPGRMAPNTALCFVLSGLGLASIGQKQNGHTRRVTTGLLSALVIGLGAVALSGYVTNVPSAYGWGQLTRMAIHTSIGFMVLGLGMLVLAWANESSSFTKVPDWLPSVIGVGLVTISVTLWQALDAHEKVLISHYGKSINFFIDEIVLFFGFAMAIAVYIAMKAAQRANRSALAWEKEAQERKLAEERLAESEVRFRTYFEMGMVGFAETSPEKGWVRVNDALCGMLGYSHDEITKLTWAELTHPDDLDKDLAQFKRLLDGEIDGYYLEKRFLNKNGKPVPTIMSVRVRRKPDGSPDYLFAVIQDISELKELEEKLHQSNAELQQFAYVASHDLQEPLRMVTNYMGLLQRRYEEKLDADANEFIGFAVDGAKRMQQLIQDLLEYSRVGTRGKEFTPSDLSLLLDEALLNLQARIEETGAEISFSQLPTLTVDGGQTVRLFQNLIGNAIKYRDADKSPKIRIEAKALAGVGNWLFQISDNGIGIANEDYERIFNIFQRLHGREEYEGTGIGLAICKKIVERHGGRIWVESTPGAGSTFFFTLPAGKTISS
jgi:PAS domain S-box-containing protein